MANKITDEQKIEINRLYKQIGTYSGVAKQMGISPASVKKYVIPNFAEEPIEKKEYEVEPQEIDNITVMKTSEDIYKATQITQEEIEEIRKLWKEIMM